MIEKVTYYMLCSIFFIEFYKKILIKPIYVLITEGFISYHFSFNMKFQILVPRLLWRKTKNTLETADFSPSTYHWHSFSMQNWVSE